MFIKSKSPYKKKAVRKNYKKKVFKKRSLVSLIKKVSLKPSETKNTHTILENQQLFHNLPKYHLGFLETLQGIDNTQSGTVWKAGRIGDEVIARGISIKLWLANKLDRPNLMWKIAVFTYQAATTPTNIFVNVNSNIMMRDYDTDKYKIIYSKIINNQVGSSSRTNLTGATIGGAEAHKYKQIWIPLKNRKIRYSGDNLNTPQWTNYGIMLTAYDSAGTSEVDNIASYSINYKFYFKDP